LELKLAAATTLDPQPRAKKRMTLLPSPLHRIHAAATQPSSRLALLPHCPLSPLTTTSLSSAQVSFRRDRFPLPVTRKLLIRSALFCCNP
jgi:hypothetical protein